MPADSPFLIDREVRIITRTSKMTRVRMEARGLFPKRTRIGARKMAWRKHEVEEWVRDPLGWAQRNSAGGQL
jgi:predicted DNA-binding transcriptional regulator AlpA